MSNGILTPVLIQYPILTGSNFGFEVDFLKEYPYLSSTPNFAGVVYRNGDESLRYIDFDFNKTNEIYENIKKRIK